jgi:hypothetical protein
MNRSGWLARQIKLAQQNLDEWPPFMKAWLNRA